VLYNKMLPSKLVNKLCVGGKRDCVEQQQQQQQRLVYT
jgi:hypothetical protein